MLPRAMSPHYLLLSRMCHHRMLHHLTIGVRMKVEWVSKLQLIKDCMLKV